MPSIDTIRGWYDFYIAIGTAAVTLLGAMFVVASIGTSFVTPGRATETRLFMTPTVTHLAAVLLGCAVAMVPSLGWTSLGVLLGLGGLIGMAYSTGVGWHVLQRQLDITDRLWYGAVPIAAYAIMTAAAWMAWSHQPASLEVLASALILLLIDGIRNAWDLIIFFMVNTS